jgi:hypothetical protein
MATWCEAMRPTALSALARAILCYRCLKCEAMDE